MGDALRSVAESKVVRDPDSQHLRRRKLLTTEPRSWADRRVFGLWDWRLGDGLGELRWGCSYFARLAAQERVTAA